MVQQVLSICKALGSSFPTARQGGKEEERGGGGTKEDVKMLCCWLWRKRGHKPRNPGASDAGKGKETDFLLEFPEGT